MGREDSTWKIRLSVRPWIAATRSHVASAVRPPARSSIRDRSADSEQHFDRVGKSNVAAAGDRLCRWHRRCSSAAWSRRSCSAIAWARRWRRWSWPACCRSRTGFVSCTGRRAYSSGARPARWHGRGAGGVRPRARLRRWPGGGDRRDQLSHALRRVGHCARPLPAVCDRPSSARSVIWARLPIRYPFHASAIDALAEPMHHFLAGFRFAPPRLPVSSRRQPARRCRTAVRCGAYLGGDARRAAVSRDCRGTWREKAWTMVEAGSVGHAGLGPRVQIGAPGSLPGRPSTSSW